MATLFFYRYPVVTESRSCQEVRKMFSHEKRENRRERKSRWKNVEEFQ